MQQKKPEHKPESMMMKGQKLIVPKCCRDEGRGFLVLVVAIFVCSTQWLWLRAAGMLGRPAATSKQDNQGEHDKRTVLPKYDPAGSNYSKPPLWFIWLGPEPMGAIHRSAIASCRKFNQDSFDVVTVGSEDLQSSKESLGFSLHPAFHLLDPVQKSDYLRFELLHHHGGIYLDADVFCFRSFEGFLQALRGKVVGGGSLNFPGNPNNNMLGPFMKNSTYTMACQKALWEHMDGLEPRLHQCAQEHPDGHGGIKYPKIIKANGKQLCGTKWGEVIDFNKPRTRAAYQQGVLVQTFKRCSPASAVGHCDVFHLGCAGHINCSDLSTCWKNKLLRDAQLCTNESSYELNLKS